VRSPRRSLAADPLPKVVRVRRSLLIWLICQQATAMEVAFGTATIGSN
jgi:hypothetical protein